GAPRFRAGGGAASRNEGRRHPRSAPPLPHPLLPAVEPDPRRSRSRRPRPARGPPAAPRPTGAPPGRGRGGIDLRPRALRRTSRMQTTERPQTGPSRPSPVRGVVLVAVAAVLGFFLLRAIDDSGSGIAVETGNPSGAETSDTTAPAASDTTAVPVRPQAEVTVIVANASGVQ